MWESDWKTEETTHLTRAGLIEKLAVSFLGSSVISLPINSQHFASFVGEVADAVIKEMNKEENADE